MRHLAASCLVLIACGGHDGADDEATIVALRTAGSPWQTITPPPCEPIEVPNDAPYELAIITHASWGSSTKVLRAGPGDDLRWSVCPDQDRPPETYDIDVDVTGSGTRWARVAVGRSGGGEAPPQVSAELGVQDIVAVPIDSLPVTSPHFILRRGFPVTRQGFSLDFTSEGRPLENRDLIVTGTDGDRYIASAQVSTVGGASLLTFPLLPSGDSAPAIWTIPAAELIEGDKLGLGISVAGNTSGVYTARTVTMDLRAVPPGPITVDVPQRIQSAACSVVDRSVALTASYAEAWNEHHIELKQIDGGAEHSPRSVRIVKRASYPPGGLDFPDLVSIPGWQDTWNMLPGTFYCGFQLCNRTALTNKCSGLTVFSAD